MSVFWLLISFFALFLIAILIWWFLPIIQTRSLRKRGFRPKELVNLENEYRRTVTPALASLLVLISASTAYYQVQQSNADMDGKVLSKALDLLDKVNPWQRLTGINLLKEWAEKDLSRNEFLAKTLMSFVRTTVKFKVPSTFCGLKEGQFAPFYPRKPESQRIGPDVQAAIDFLKAEKIHELTPLDFSELDLSYADFSGLRDGKGLSFSFSDLSGAKFTGAELVNPNFYCANLFEANLSHSKMTGAKPKIPASSKDKQQLNFVGSLMVKADLREAELVHANLSDVKLNEAELYRVNLKGALAVQTNFYQASNLNAITIDKETNFHNACIYGTEHNNLPEELVKDTVNTDPDKDNEKYNSTNYPTWCKQ